MPAGGTHECPHFALGTPLACVAGVGSAVHRTTDKRRTAMMTKALSIGVGIVALATSAVAAGLTEQLQADRMTVVQVDRTRAKFLCAEHRNWTAVPPADVPALSVGDIVAVERSQGRVAKVRVVRTAADELSSPER
jgi:hypothetical protein